MLLPLLIVFAFGACIGSFVNVLVYRLPESQSVVRPGSRCRSCGRVCGIGSSVARAFAA